MMTFNIGLIFSILLTINSAAAQIRDNTANYGDKLDANEIPAEEEYRVHESPNRPDHIDENYVPEKAEERLREEEVEPVEIDPNYKILVPLEE